MRRRVVLGLAMLVVAAVVAPERAGAAVGDLGFAGCLADDPAGRGRKTLGGGSGRARLIGGPGRDRQTQ